MFSHSKDTSLDTGKRNAKAVKEELEDKDIELIGEDVGGNTGRSVELSTSSGSLTIRKKI